MAEVKANLQQIRRVYEEFSEEYRSLRQMIRELEQLGSDMGIAWKGDTMQSLRRKLQLQTENLEERRRQLLKMMEALEMIYETYSECEERLVEEAQDGEISASALEPELQFIQLDPGVRNQLLL